MDFFADVAVPSKVDLGRKIMQYYHNTPMAGHPGRDETIQVTKQRY
jgi:hypothetical protein